MGAKKVRSLLKGVAITGASVGGAALLGDADLVYAMVEEAAEIVVETTPEPTQSLEAQAPAPAAEQVVEAPAPAAVEVQTPAPVVETPVAETPVVETPVAETPVAETPVAETPTAETPAVAATVSAPAASVSTSPPAASAQTVMPAASAIVNPVIAPIDDAIVPLEVIIDEGIGEEVTGGNSVIEGRTIEATDNTEVEVTQIEDDNAAKGVTVTENQSFVKRNFWWGIIALIIGKLTYDKVKKGKEKEKE
jgi:hypothetical protein